MHRAALALGAFLLAGPALAEDMAASDGRYALQPVPDGVARLDTRTGAVAICARQDGGAWACRTAADDRRALSDELQRLERENAELRRQLAARGPAPRQSPLAQRPTEREVDDALALMERFMDRAKRMIDRWREEDRARPGPNRT